MDKSLIPDFETDIEAVLRKHGVFACCIAAFDNGNNGSLRAVLHKFQIENNPLYLFVNDQVFEGLFAAVKAIPSATVLAERTTIMPKNKPAGGSTGEMPH